MIVKRKPIFEQLKQGLEEGIAHAKGERTLRTVEVPQEGVRIKLSPRGRRSVVVGNRERKTLVR
jgi:hypothetical protein